MLLFVFETLLASALLATRLRTGPRAVRDEPEACLRQDEAWRMLLWFVGPFSLACAGMLAGLALLEADNGRLQGWGGDFGDRVRWMALTLLASAALDSAVAPVRSAHWLETMVSWQGSRTAVLLLAVLLGWPVILIMGTAQGFFWTFFALRLLSDLGGLKRGERERIRARVFGEPFPGAGDSRPTPTTGRS